MAAHMSRTYPLRFLTLPVLVGWAFVAFGCAGPGTAPGSSSRGNSADVVTGEQIRATSANNLYDALEQLRPRWLLPRGRASIAIPDATEPVVYLYGVRHGFVNTLYGINVNAVRRVEFIGPLDATTRYGTGHSGGIIDVELEGGSAPGR